MKRRSFALGLMALALTACAGDSPVAEHGGGHGGDRTGPLQARELVIYDEGYDEDAVRFVILERDPATGEFSRAFTDYGVSHTKEMHLIAVTADTLTFFDHLHPERDATGVWSVPYRPEKGGRIWFYADFVDRAGHPYLLRFERSYPAAAGAHYYAEDFSREKTFDGYRVTLDVTELDGGGVQLNYEILDTRGQPAALELYLGEKAHAVLISREGEYMHTHPFKEYTGYSEEDPPVLVTEPLRAPFYRIFTQVQVQGKIIPTVFDYDRSAE